MMHIVLNRRSLVSYLLILFNFLSSSAWNLGMESKIASVMGSMMLSVNPFSSNYLNYDNFAFNYDNLNTGTYTKFLKIDDMRSLAGSFVNNKVLEIAVGTGIQTNYYNWDNIESYTAIDSSEGMLKQMSQKINDLSFDKKYNLFVADATNIPLTDSQYDTVIDTFSMCVFDEPYKVLKEMKRLVKPDVGRIILLENSRSTLPLLGWFQDKTEALITPLSKGCKWNVNIPIIANEVGDLKLEKYDSIQLGTISLSIYNKLK